MKLIYNRQAGFSLLEILVAFAILSISLGLIFQIYSQSSRSTALARDHLAAISIARSRLAIMDTQTVFKAGIESGTAQNRFHWTREITQHTDLEPSRFQQSYRLFKIRISVSWQTLGQDRSYTIESIRLGID